MKLGQRKIDHIVYCVKDLEKGMDDLETRLGIRPIYGGQHLTRGTHNALLDLGEDCYLEVLAIDPYNKSISENRWMGIELIDQPTVTRWALKSEDLAADQANLMQIDENLGRIRNGSRKTSAGLSLSWQMILPQSGPRVQVLPFMVDWSESEVHPCIALTKRCRLKSIELTYPHNHKIDACLSNLLGASIEAHTSLVPSIRVDIEGIYGDIVL